MSSSRPTTSAARTQSTAKLLKPDSAPPRAIVRMVMALRNFLFRMTDVIVPPQIAMIERLGGYYMVCAVHAAAKLRLADQLDDGPKSAAELARAVGAREDLLKRLLRALVSFGVFEMMADGRYRQNRLSKILREGTQGSMRELAMFVAAPYHLGAWNKFTDGLRTGENSFQSMHGEKLFDYLNHNPEDGAHFAGAMVSLTEIDASTLAASYNFGSLGEGARVCDVAGGRGTLLVPILVRYPKLRGVLFDEAAVVDSAPAYLDSYGVGERVERIAGNFFQTVPSGCAVYMLKDILHDWDDDGALTILKNIRKVMQPGGILLVAEMVVDGPEDRYFGTLLDLEMMVVTHFGMQRSEAQFKALFARAGFRLSRILGAASPTSWVEAIAE